MRRRLPLLLLLFSGLALAAVPPGSEDPEPPDAQSRAVAALPHGRVLSVVASPAKSIAGIGGATGGEGKVLQARVSGLDAAMSDLGARVIGQEIHVELPADVLFDFDRATIRPDAEETLGKLALVVRAHPEGNVRVEGHTDGKGAPAYHVTLSEHRARAVVAWLQAHGGLSSANFAVHAWGAARPVAPNTNPDGSDNPKGRQRNRRVEVVIRMTKTREDVFSSGTAPHLPSDGQAAEGPRFLATPPATPADVRLR
jgi:outer membrane protein OmpA-like peptidoglycan-associated protein